MEMISGVSFQGDVHTMALAQGQIIVQGYCFIIERAFTVNSANGMALFQVQIPVRHEAIAMSRITPKPE
jgi:hypothetical protein